MSGNLKLIDCSVIGGNQANKERLCGDEVRIENVRGPDYEYEVKIWNAPGEGRDSRLDFFVENHQVFIYAFSIVRPQTLDRVHNYSVRLTSQVQGEKPVILVGLDKGLLEKDKRSEWEEGMEEIPRERIDEVARAINAVEYIEWFEGDAESDAKLIDAIMRLGAPYARTLKSRVKIPEGHWCEVV